MDDKKPADGEEASQVRTTREISSADLLGSDRMIIINHATEQYRLMITRNNKLILQK